MQTGALGSGRRDDCHRHVVARWHGERTAPGCRERIGAVLAGDAEALLDRGVVRLEVVVGDGPVGHGRVVEGSSGRVEPEVLVAEAGQLGVGVDAAAADRDRQVVDLAGEEAVSVGLASTVGAGFEDRVGSQEVASGGGDLVVGEVAQRLVRWFEIDEVVAPLLQDDHRPPGRGEDLCRGGAAGARPDDDGVAVGHEVPPVVRAGGKRGSGKSMRCHPPPPRLPP